VTAELLSDDEGDLRDLIALAIEGAPCSEVISALGSLLAQAIADGSSTVDVACETARRLGNAVADDIAENWHLVTARRIAG
jgi:hypothetical protein